MSTIALLASLLASLLLLVITKVADVVTTVRHLGPAAETNPLARRFFARFGFAFVCLLWLAIVAVTYTMAFLQPSAIYRWLTAIVGIFISWIQWETARFNATGRHGWFTRMSLRGYHHWEAKWRH